MTRVDGIRAGLPWMGERRRSACTDRADVLDGIDLAKNVLAVHGINEAAKAEPVRPAVPRDKVSHAVAPVGRPAAEVRHGKHDQIFWLDSIDD